MLKKNLKVALYDPFLDTLGGGEKHVLSILKVLEDERYEITIFWNKNLQKSIGQRFSLHYINKMKWLSNIFKFKTNLFQKLKILRDFDLFFYVTDGSYFFSSAKKNFIFCMVPKRDLYNMNLINELKTLNYRFVSNSGFTQSWLKTWGIESKVIYPYLNKEFINFKVENLQKQQIILSIGRFFQHLHAKKQSELINLFKQLKQKYLLFKNFRLILAGGLKEEDKQYFNRLQKLVKEEPDIDLIINPSYNKLLSLYKKSLIYLHMAGYGVDETKNPEMVEHLGIAPLEAMASGCITFCYNAGGPKELIKNDNNGFLFKNEKELINKILAVINNQPLQQKIQSYAKKFVTRYFTYEAFKKRVREVIL